MITFLKDGLILDCWTAEGKIMLKDKILVVNITTDAQMSADGHV